MEIYLDNNATTRPLPDVVNVMAEVLRDDFGNPSSAHNSGARARRLLATAREQVAEMINAVPEQVIFTGSGSESNNQVLRSCFAPVSLGRCIVVSAVEHSSILRSCDYLMSQGMTVKVLPVDPGGRVDVEELERVVESDVALVSIQWVNNETGVIQPMDEISRVCHRHGIPLHSDAAQAVGKLHVDVAETPVDFLTFTAHKVHGPKGIGAIWARSRQSLRPLVFGGPQEFGLRAGTENVAGIVGFGRALALRRTHFSEVNAAVAGLRDKFERAVLTIIPGACVNGNTQNRVGCCTNIQFPGADGQALVVRLDQVGVRCSQSSACTSMYPDPSYVLTAMGLSEGEARASIRFGFSELNTADEIERAASLVYETYFALAARTSELLSAEAI